MNKEIIAFNKGMVVPPDNGQDNRIVVSTMQVELLRFGYILTEEAFMELSKADTRFIESWFTHVVLYLKAWLDMAEYQPIYRDFPRTVMNSSIEQLFFEQMLNYWTSGEIHFDEEVQKEIKYEEVAWKKIKFGTEEDFRNIFKQLAQVNTALTPTDYKIIEWFAKEYKSYNLPDSIPFKENLCMLAALGVKVPVKTPTDVLRIAFYFSTGKADLVLEPRKVPGMVGWRRGMIDNPERHKTKFRLTNKQYRLIIDLLETVPYISEMKERHKMWNKLAHGMHPTKYEASHPQAVKALRAMNSNNELFKLVKTYNSKIENTVDPEAKLELLKQRPGMLARKLNELLLRMSPEMVLAAFQVCGSRISNKVLFELYTYFEGRTEYNGDRKVFIKGARKPVKLPDLPALDSDLVETINDTIWFILGEKFAELEPMGKIYIDEELKKIPLPTNMRSLEESLTPVVRGQRTPIDLNKRYALMFCCWDGRTDLDFTVSIYDKNGNIQKVGYGGSGKTSDNTILFSGDNTGRYAHNSELISIDLAKSNAKYVLATVNVFRNATGEPNAFKGCNASLGIQARSDIEQSQNFRPETVQFIMKPRTKAQQLNAFIFDVEAKEFIMIDEDAYNVPVSNPAEILRYIKQLSEMPKLSVYDLLLLHVQNRGQLVSEVEEADDMFVFEDFSKDYTKTVEFML